MSQYVKFLRGLHANYEKLTVKDSDTLYFTTAAADSTTGRLFLGDVEITGSTTSEGIVPSEITLGELKNINLSEPLGDNNVLVYDATNSEWVNKTIGDLITTMVGATADKDGSSGLVPAPKTGDQNKFLRGDGTWVTVDIGEIDGMLDTLEERLTTINGDIDKIEAALGTIEENPSITLVTKVENLEKILNDTTETTTDPDTGAETTTTKEGLVTQITNLYTTVNNHETRITNIENALSWQDIPTGE